MQRRLAVAVCCLLVACGDPSSSPASRSSPVESPRPELLEVDATVLEEQGAAPMLCLSVILESLPPQCGDVPLENWEWEHAEGEERLGGTTWGEFHVTGTYDGETFTVADISASRERPSVDEGDPFASPCPEPPGGWTSLDATRDEDSDRAAAMAAAQREPDFAGAWIDRLDHGPVTEETGPYVLNLAFTGDLQRHEADIRRLWGGPLCVSQKDTTFRELRRIQRGVGGTLRELGVRELTSDIDVVRGEVTVHVVHVDAEDRGRLRDRYGDALQVVARLQPVD